MTTPRIGAVLALGVWSCTCGPSPTDGTPPTTEPSVPQSPTTPRRPTDHATGPSLPDPAPRSATAGFFDAVATAYLDEGEQGRRTSVSGYDPSRIESWPLDGLTDWIDSGGVTFDDVNLTPRTTRIGRPQVLRELAAKSGRVHSTFAHLAHTLTHPSPRYWSLQESHDTANVTVVVGKPAVYRLTFVTAAGHPKLSKVEYLHYDVE